MARGLSVSDVRALLRGAGLRNDAVAVLGLTGGPRCAPLAAALTAAHPRLALAVAPPPGGAIGPPVAGAAYAPPGLPRGEAMRFFAAEAVRRGGRAVVLGSSRADAAAAAIGLPLGPEGKGGGARILRFEDGLGGLRPVDAVVDGCEMLPPGLLRVLRPLMGVPLDVYDATVAGAGEAAKAAEMLGGVDLGAVIGAGDRRRVAAEEMREASDALLRDAVVDVSHWGYVAVCRDTLVRAYSDRPGGGRELACDVLARLVMHVTGVDRGLSFHSRLVEQLAAEILHPLSAGAVPTGRTLCGALLRPATGPSADAFHRKNQRRRGVRVSSARDSYRAGGRKAEDDRQRAARAELHGGGGGGGGGGAEGGDRNASTGHSPYAMPREERRDLLVVSREPDRESSHLRVKRMGGNLSALPIPIGRDHATYWDSRFVLSAAPVDELEPDSPVVTDETVLLAALSAPRAVEDSAWKDATFYVRQLRHVDWEYINSTTDSVRMRNFRAPYQCIRGLPAIYQKQVGDLDQGVLAAVPHLGLSGRSDMVFTAVRMPRFRCIPADMEPGFQVLPDMNIEPRDAATAG